MKKLLLSLSLLLLTSLAVSGPPEPPETPVPPDINIDVNLDSLRNLDREIRRIDKKLKGFDNLLEKLDADIHIKSLTIGGDSIRIILENDSSFIFMGLDSLMDIQNQDDIFRVGDDVVVKLGDEVDGDIVVIRGDVTVNGKVKGGVMVIGGNIYVSSTGFIQEAAIAFSGKVKQEPGARVGNVKLSVRDTSEWESDNKATYRIMALVFIIIFAIWWSLSATCASLFKPNVERIIESVKFAPIKSYFKGYLAYLIAFGLFIALTITIIGIPLAFVGVPLLTMAAMIMSTAAMSILIGQKIQNSSEYNFRTFVYGSLVVGIIPALLFFIQLVFGSLVAMVFNWILISAFVLVIVPIGLGGVLSTRFGTRRDKHFDLMPIPTAPPPNIEINQ